MRSAVLFALFLTVAAHAATVDNDDSCDISVLPAATLLLPYFEVDLRDPLGETTLFSVTNVTNLDQIAHVTLWTDYGYPVINFNIYLTGYDVQAINLYDVIARGMIAPDAGTGTTVSKRGSYSDPNAVLDLTYCDQLPGRVPGVYIERMQNAFTRGFVDTLGTIEGCTNIGGVHERAIGYATIDVTGNCGVRMATDPAYWTEDIRYDNVLIGDYRQVNDREGSAEGGSLVHIRAVPEGGTPASRRTLVKYDAGFPQTFYGRFQAPDSPRLDGRQPLPSTFAARWISGGPGGFATSLKVWREGKARSAACAGADSGADLRAMEIVTFDEEGHAAATSTRRARLPVTSSTPVTDAAVFPQPPGGVTAGWLYLNLDESLGDGRASQGWVICSMRAADSLSTDVEAMAFGNGCSAPALPSASSIVGGNPIAPAPDANAGGVMATINNDDSCDITLLPAATLLLPYFEVDVEDPLSETTLFTVTNVSPHEQIAHVTLWTDYGYPVLGFNIVLGPYDVQSVNLSDVLVRGVIAPGAIRTHACSSPGTIALHLLPLIQQAFTLGRARDVGPLASCNTIGNAHGNAAGYATIDVLRACASEGPRSPEYWRTDLGYANVLTGDSQQISGADHSAQGSPLVHVRAIPEGGDDEPGFAHTFYGRFQNAVTPKRDGRQPLPSAFAARWVREFGISNMFYKVWRSGRRTGEACSDYVIDGGLPVAEIVRFDDAENATAELPRSNTLPINLEPALPLTSRTSVTDSSVYPQLANGAVSGWMYMNLDEACNHTERDCPPNPFGAQGWVVTSMRSAGRATDTDAAALGNGCSAPAAESEILHGTAVIGPAPNRN